MQMLERNKQTFYYALKVRESPIMESLYETGEYIPIYGTAVLGKANISASNGEYETSVFGNSDRYDKIIVFDNEKYPITETTIFWIDDRNVSHQHDYEVYKIAKSLNVTSVAVHKVKVNA